MMDSIKSLKRAHSDSEFQWQPQIMLKIYGAGVSVSYWMAIRIVPAKGHFWRPIFNDKQFQVFWYFGEYF